MMRGQRERAFTTRSSRARSIFAGLVLAPAILLLSQLADTPKSEEYLLLGSPNRGAGDALMLSADNTKQGRYALARQSGQQILVSMTEDGGQTWLPPVVAAEVPAAANFGHRAMKIFSERRLRNDLESERIRIERSMSGPRYHATAPKHSKRFGSATLSRHPTSWCGETASSAMTCLQWTWTANTCTSCGATIALDLKRPGMAGFP